MLQHCLNNAATAAAAAAAVLLLLLVDTAITVTAALLYTAACTACLLTHFRHIQLRCLALTTSVLNTIAVAS
jgi:hypothetical protein